MPAFGSGDGCGGYLGGEGGPGGGEGHGGSEGHGSGGEGSW